MCPRLTISRMFASILLRISLMIIIIIAIIIILTVT